MKLPKQLLLFLTVFMLVLHSTAQRPYTGFKYLENYTPETYKLLAQNWCILQTPGGIVYAANQGGILEFDGVSWRRTIIHNFTVRSMAMASDGTIYIGGLKEIGSLRPNENGELKYVSLMDRLDKKHHDFSAVYQVHCTAAGTWFRTAYKLLRWHNNQFTVKTPETPKASFKAMFTWKDRFFVQEGNAGLRRFTGDSFQNLPVSKTFGREKIAMAAPYNEKTLLVGTSFKGFYLCDETKAHRFPTEVDDYLKKYRLYHGIRLSDGSFALATIGGGLVIMDAGGRILEIFNTAAGLQDANVKYVYEGAGGILWLGLNTGISRIDAASPISFFDRRSDLKEIVTTLTRFGGRLYVGTSNGLFYLKTAAHGSIPVFRSVSGVSGHCWDLLTTGDSLLVATSRGVFSVDDRRPYTARKEEPATESLVLSASREFPGRVWVGTADQLWALHRENGRWVTKLKIDNKQQDAHSIVEDENGNLWLGSRTQGLFKVDFTAGGSAPRITRRGTDHDLLEGDVHVVRAAGRVMFLTKKGLFRLDEKGESFVPDPLLGEQFAGGKVNVFRLAEDRDKRIWFHSGRMNFCALPNPDGTYSVSGVPFLRMPRTQVNTIYPDGQMIWLGGTSGLIRYDTAARKDYARPFSALIRKVTVKGRTLVFGGSEPRTGSPFMPVLEYKNRNLEFEAAAPFFEEDSQTRYQYLMEGNDDDWSDWTAASFKHYTNIDAGKHNLRVRARNIYGTVSREGVFTFEILPPWYRTWWAYAVYAAAAFLMVYLIVRWRSAALVQKTQRLERVIKERTRLINQANAKLQQKTRQLEDQSEKLKELDKAKSRFFANISHEFRTPLTLILGPLDQVRTLSKDPETTKRVGLARRNAQRLLGLINQLLDLSKFESGKMKLRASQTDLVLFLKSFLEPFEAAARQQQLELNISTAETSIPLYFDPEKLEKVVGNLLSNAFKFTPPGGRITVSVTRCPKDGSDGEPEGGPRDNKRYAEGYVTVSVKDTGCGIPGEHLEHIFDRFYQADTTAEHHQKGSGIGLALAKELVELHHGELTVQSSVGEAGGSEFIVTLPMGRSHLSAGEVMEGGNASPEQTETPPLPPDGVEGPLEVEDAGELTGGSEIGEVDKHIILVVEDNADLRHYIRSSLEPDFDVIEAKDGEEGIERAKAVIPDLVVSDIMMPGVDGYELCRVVKSDVSTSHIPVILLTARASEESIVEGLETGADDYVTKPFNTRVLRARIGNLIELRRQLQISLSREMVLQPARMTMSTMDREFLNDLQAVLEKNLSDPDFNVEELSKRLYMSRTTVYRKIQALSGETPTDFIRYFRLKRAAQLLKSNFGSVTEVAFEVGFNSRAYFTKCFKEQFHQLPSEYVSSQSS